MKFPRQWVEKILHHPSHEIPLSPPHLILMMFRPRDVLRKYLKPRETTNKQINNIKCGGDKGGRWVKLVQDFLHQPTKLFDVGVFVDGMS